MREAKLLTAELTSVTTSTSWSSASDPGLDQARGQCRQGVGLAAARHGDHAHAAGGEFQDALLGGTRDEFHTTPLGVSERWMACRNGLRWS